MPNIEKGTLIQHMEQKTQPQVGRTMFPTVKTRVETGTYYASNSRTELTLQGIRSRSIVLVSPLGKRIITQNPGFLRDILERADFPDQEDMPRGAHSLVDTHSYTLDGAEDMAVIKYHGEGEEEDIVNGFDNFKALRAIDLLSNLLVPKPLFATNRVFVSQFVDGDNVRKVPNWVKKDAHKALQEAYKEGWFRSKIRKERLVYKLFPTNGFFEDFDAPGNVLRVGDNYCIVDPIY